MGKKKLLFVITHMGLGGAEKALVSLFHALDYQKYDVDLLMYSGGGINLQYVPSQVNILPAITENISYFADSMDVIKIAARKRDFLTIIRILYYYSKKKIICHNNEAEIRYYNWRFIRKYIKNNDKKYDTAVAFLDGTPHYYVIEKVTAQKKICWVHNDYSKMDVCLKDEEYLNKADVVATISPKCVDEIKKKFPSIKNVELVYNLNSPSLIKSLSNEIINDRAYFEEKRVKLLSVGRICEQKAYHLAVKAAVLLKKKGIDFHWYILGEGELRNAIQEQINDSKLEDCFTILGVRDNPYPYMKEADYIIQTSLYEGKSIALDEAKILQKLIVCTNYNSAKDQIEDGHTGVLVAISAEGICEGIVNLMNNQELSNRILADLRKEDYSIKEYLCKYEKVFS